jgi:DNA-binding PadR family transcriptional regulator
MITKHLTNLEYALLGLIGISPMTGYDIHKLFETTPFGHFSSSPGAIYPALNRLARRSLLHTSMDKRKEARPRRIYSLTKIGEEALSTWLHQQVTRDELIRMSGAPILRFNFAKGRLSIEEILTYLESYRRAVAAYIDELLSYDDQLKAPEMYHNRLALEHGIRRYRSELEWVKSATAAFKSAPRNPRKDREPRKKGND